MPEAPTQVRSPAVKTILKATGIALAVAVVILFVAVLPAEYGIDPLRTGAMLGLTGISQSTDGGTSGRATPAQAGVVTPQPATYKVDSEDLGLAPGDSVEIKYHMVKGAVMVYAWKADGKVQFEFHGEPDKKPRPDYFESYELDSKVGRDHSYGSFTAPSTGIHGWFWENKGNKDIRFHLSTAGFYDSAKVYTGGPPEDVPVEDVK